MSFLPMSAGLLSVPQNKEKTLSDRLAFAARVLSDPNGPGFGYQNALLGRRQEQEGLLANKIREAQLAELEQKQKFQANFPGILDKLGHGANSIMFGQNGQSAPNPNNLGLLNNQQIGMLKALPPDVAMQLLGKVVENQFTQQGADSPMGKLASDLRNGLITDEQYQQAIQAMMPASTNTTIDMGGKWITPADALKMRDANGQMPPVGMTWDQAKLGGYQVYNEKPPETVMKQQSLSSAAKLLPKLDSLIYDKKGAVDRTNLFNSSIGTPGTKGKDLDQMFEVGIQAITRGETGAAMQPSELANTRKRFQPSFTDSDEMIATKLQLYKEMISGSLKLIEPSADGPVFRDDIFQAELVSRLQNSGRGNSKLPPPGFTERMK